MLSTLSKYFSNISNSSLYSYLVLKQDLSDEEKKAVVKGCFLGSGSVNNPEKQNHLEVCFWGKESLEYVNNICRSYGIILKELISEDKYEEIFAGYRCGYHRHQDPVVLCRRRASGPCLPWLRYV